MTPSEELATRYDRRRALADFPDPVPENENPRALFKGGWLRKGGGALFVGMSGVGKSVAATQFAACFAIGRPWLGITPLRPLQISVYQWEDDEDEVVEFREHLRRGFASAEWTNKAIDEAFSKITYHDVTGLTGDKFFAFLAYAQKRYKADLIVLMPLQSFANCDISKNENLSTLLRDKLDPILKNPLAPCACIIVHHTNKIPSNGRERHEWIRESSAAYAGAGGAELTNWARAILTLGPQESTTGYFDLIAAKRGERLGWKDAGGNPTLVKHVAHSDVMFWREVSPEELAAIKPMRKRRRNAKCDKVLELCRENGKPFESGEALVRAIRKNGIAEKTLARKLINSCIAHSELIKRKGDHGNRDIIGLPEQMHL